MTVADLIEVLQKRSPDQPVALGTISNSLSDCRILFSVSTEELSPWVVGISDDQGSCLVRMTVLWPGE